jgi:hypothetical protein
MTPGAWSTTCAAITFTLAVGQTAQNCQRVPPRPITVTGCIQRAVRGSETKFLLMNAVVHTADATAAAGAAPPGTAAETTYRLHAEDAMITPHLGHLVEIAGVIEEEAFTSPAQSKSGLLSTRRAALLKVNTIGLIASACP